MKVVFINVFQYKCSHFLKQKETCLWYKYCKIKLFSAAISYGAFNEPEAYLEPSQTSTRENFMENSHWLRAVNYFCKKAP